MPHTTSYILAYNNIMDPSCEYQMERRGPHTSFQLCWRIQSSALEWGWHLIPYLSHPAEPSQWHRHFQKVTECRLSRQPSHYGWLSAKQNWEVWLGVQQILLTELLTISAVMGFLKSVCQRNRVHPPTLGRMLKAHWIQRLFHTISTRGQFPSNQIEKGCTLW